MSHQSTSAATDVSEFLTDLDGGMLDRAEQATTT